MVVLFCWSGSYAAIPAPTAPPTSSDGNYSVSFQYTGASSDCYAYALQERSSPSQPWSGVTDDGADGVIAFQNKPQGAHEYRVVAHCILIGFGEYDVLQWEETSPSTTTNDTRSLKLPR